MEALAIGALTAALALTGARVELLDLKPAALSGCEARSAATSKKVDASGKIAVRFTGTTPAGAECQAWAWADVKVLAPALVAARDVADGAPLEPAAFRAGEEEVRPGRPPVTALPDGATALRALPVGTVLEPQHVRLGPPPGEAIVVLVRDGALEVEQPGRATACARDRVCAILPNGRRVEGQIERGRLVVAAP
jgi:hypothetical protein